MKKWSRSTAYPRKHGIRLSGIMGHTGEIKENEIKLCRELALKKLGLEVT